MVDSSERILQKAAWRNRKWKTWIKKNEERESSEYYPKRFSESKIRKKRDTFDDIMVDNFPELIKLCVKVNNQESQAK